MEAAIALASVGNKAGLQKIIKFLAKKYSNPFVRRRAIEALGNLGDKSLIPHLIKELHHEDKMMREEAAKAIGKINSRKKIGGHPK